MLSQKQEHNQNAIVIAIGLLFSFFLQLIKFDIFPQKYFYDARAMQDMLQSANNFKFGDSYGVTAWLLRWLNQWFVMDSQLEGGLTIWCISSIPFLWLVLKIIHPTWRHYCFFTVYCVLLPVFVLNTQKEAVQYFFFILLLFVAEKGKNLSNVDLLIVLLLGIWGLLFRPYYLIIAIMTAGFMIATKIPWNKIDLNIKIKILLFVVFIVFSFLCILNIFYPSLFRTVFESRAYTNQYREGSPDATTIIQETIQNPNHSVVICLINYIIVAARMMVPLELLFVKVKYFPYVILQLVWTAFVGREILRLFECAGRKTKTVKTHLTPVLIAWYFTAFLFEPDFGSFIRHQTACFPISFAVLMDP